MQSGQKSIKAFCLGCIKPYFTPLTLSAKTRLLPRVTRLLTLLGETMDPTFRYTSMQCNSMYSARLHVDKNNHGPSQIIGLGPYTGGELWVYQEEGGNIPMVVTEPLRGYPHLTVGKVIYGRLHSIRNAWFSFDGRVPHSAMPFEGDRLSIVYFTRSGAGSMLPQLREALEDLGVRVPDPEWLAATAPETASASRPQKMPRLSEPQPPDDDSDDDEADLEAAELSTGRMDFDVFRQELQVPWHRLELPVGLTSCCPGVGAAYALQQLLPVAPTQVSLVHEGEVSDELCRLGKNLRVQECFKELPSSSALRHCEVRRRKEEMMPASAEHIFHAEFEVLPLMAYFFKTGLEQDKAVPARTLLAIQAHLRDRQPPVALVEVPDWEKLHGSQQRRALDFIREQISVPGYHFELVLAQLRDYGLPLTGCRLQAFMARTDCMGQEKLKQTAQLAKHLGSLLPKCRVQDFLLSESEELRVPDCNILWDCHGSLDSFNAARVRGNGSARGIHIVRDPARMLASAYCYHHRGEEPGNPLSHLPEMLSMGPVEGMMTLWPDMLPLLDDMTTLFADKDGLYHVRYENLTESSASFDLQIGGIFDFLFGGLISRSEMELIAEAAKEEDLNRDQSITKGSTRHTNSDECTDAALQAQSSMDQKVLTQLEDLKVRLGY
ncbi:unnamed protein product [Effrenium voratum]|nr:unnamed protein product [Effrenium voratum]